MSSINDVPIIELETTGNAITKGMYFFIGSSSSGPFNSFQVFHIGFQDEPLFIKNFMQNVLNSVVSIPLILKPLKRLSVVAEIQGDLGLQAFLH